MTKSTGGLIMKEKDFTFKNPSNEERKSFKSIKTMDPETPNLSQLISPEKNPFALAKDCEIDPLKQSHATLFGVEEKKKPKIKINVSKIENKPA